MRPSVPKLPGCVIYVHVVPLTGQKISHGAAGHKQASLLAEYCSCLCLQLGESGILAVDIVAHHSAGHARTHLRCRLADGVRAQVNDVVALVAVVASHFTVLYGQRKLDLDGDVSACWIEN